MSWGYLGGRREWYFIGREASVHGITFQIFGKSSGYIRKWDNLRKAGELLGILGRILTRKGYDVRICV